MARTFPNNYDGSIKLFADLPPHDIAGLKAAGQLLTQVQSSWNQLAPNQRRRAVKTMRATFPDLNLNWKPNSAETTQVHLGAAAAAIAGILLEGVKHKPKQNQPATPPRKDIQN